MADYPGVIPSLKSDFVNTTENEDEAPGWQNQVSEELEAVMTVLGTNPAAAAADVDTRFETIEVLRQGRGLGILVHGANANNARPTEHHQYVWVGTVEPNNGAANDIYLDTNP